MYDVQSEREKVLINLYRKLDEETRDGNLEGAIEWVKVITPIEQANDAEIKLRSADANESARIDLDIDKFEFEKAQKELENERHTIEYEEQLKREHKRMIGELINSGVSLMIGLVPLAKAGIGYKMGSNFTVNYLAMQNEYAAPKNDLLGIAVQKPSDLFK